ncbi:MAG TPA: pilus assembly protein TadG-related protein [Beijerinckiaceae bacterium]|jgi:hypothetical protein
MRAFIDDRAGTVGLIFGLALLPLLGGMGVAVDFARSAQMRERMRVASDQLAVNIAATDASKAIDSAAIAEAARQRLLSSMPGVRSVNVQGRWLDSANYEVVIRSTLDNMLVAAVPGMPKTSDLQIATVVKRIPAEFLIVAPESSMLEPEAADYNRLYMYCYYPKWREDPNTRNDSNKGRREFKRISDNATPSSTYNDGVPNCNANEVPSYMIRNVRNARAEPGKWDTDRNYYEYFSDSVFSDDTKVYTHTMVGERIDSQRNRSAVNFGGNPMLETVLCDTKEQCKSRDQGGILSPRQTGKTPASATGACPIGKYMYFGYEDRWDGDKDYDDIRVVIRCPGRKDLADKQVRIVK